MESKNKNIYILKVSLLRLFHILSIQEKESENKAEVAGRGWEGTISVCRYKNSNHS